MLIAIIIITFLVLCAIPGIAACMRSSQISQMMEEQERYEQCDWLTGGHREETETYDDPNFLERD